MTESKSVYSSS